MNLNGNSSWPDKIAELHSVKIEEERVDKSGLVFCHPPKPAATQEQLADAAKCLGESLDQEYRDFLMCANGWKNFFLWVHLFGTDALIGSVLMDKAMKLLKILDEVEALEHIGFSRAELLPIGVSPDQGELFLITRQVSSDPGMVILFGSNGIEMDRFPGFEAFFSDVIGYHYQSIEDEKMKFEEEFWGIEDNLDYLLKRLDEKNIVYTVERRQSGLFFVWFDRENNFGCRVGELTIGVHVLSSSRLFNLDEGKKWDISSIHTALDYVFKMMDNEVFEELTYKRSKLCHGKLYMIINGQEVIFSNTLTRIFINMVPFLKKEIRKKSYRYQNKPD